MVCRELLLTLHRKGLLDYPPPKIIRPNKRKVVKNIKRISSNWLKIYHYPLYMLETFVEQDRFKGICYKAANWIHFGETKGTSKKGHKYLKHGKIKDVYLCPLDKNFKRVLRNDTV